MSPLAALANGFVTFGSYNHIAKADGRVLALWARVLEAVPRSRLVLKAKPFASSELREDFYSKLGALGVDRERVTLLPLLPHNTKHLSAYSRVDISLDTFPYAGTTTTCEALLMGVPVVTLRGNSHAHNVGVSLLTSIGRPEWVAADADEYVAIATALAADIPALAEIRAKLRDALLGSYLCDGPAFTKNLEATFTDLWARWVADRASLSDR